MATRDELYEKFGPAIVEAVVQVMLEELNLIRTELALANRTTQQLLDAVEAKYAGLADYTWQGGS